MGIKSDLGNSESKEKLDRITTTVKALQNANDTPRFLFHMVSLSSLLSRLDRGPEKTYPFIDENVQDPTYFIAAYFDTKSITEAVWVYRIVGSLTRYILLSDKFSETGNDRYSLLAQRVLESITQFLQQSESGAQHLVYSINYSLGQFEQFWDLERIVKLRMLENRTFSYGEIRHFLLSKSSDASLVNAKVLDAKLPSFNENVSLVLHFNQALLDLHDDWDDMEEDIQEDMPNIFVMAALDGSISYSTIKKDRHDFVKRIVTGKVKSAGSVVRLVNELHASIRCVSIPENFAFLKMLSDRYSLNLKRKISPRHSQ